MMQQDRKPPFRYCVVPMCKNSNRNAPNKVFFFVPRGADIRRRWCKIMKRDMVSPSTCLYCCEDHFDLEEDTSNYIQYKIMNIQEKQKTVLRLKKGILPHKFLCQNTKPKLSLERQAYKKKVTKPPELSQVSSGTSEEQTSSNHIDDSDDYNGEYVDLNEKMCDLEKQIDSLEKQPKYFDRLFEDYGEIVTNFLKSLPLKSALRLQKELDKVIKKFYLKQQQKKSKKTLKKSNVAAKNSFNQDAYVLNHINELEATLIKSNTPNITSTPNRLAESNEDVNSHKSIPLSHVRVYGSLVSTIQQEKYGKPGQAVLKLKAPVKKSSNQATHAASQEQNTPNTQEKEDNRADTSFGINPGGQKVIVVKSLQGRSRPSILRKTTQGEGRYSNKPQTRPLFKYPDPEVIESEKHTRLENDDEVDIVMKLEEEEECLVKTEHDSYDDESNINVKLEQVDECIVKIEHDSDIDDPL